LIINDLAVVGIHFSGPTNTTSYRENPKTPIPTSPTFRDFGLFRTPEPLFPAFPGPVEGYTLILFAKDSGIAFKGFMVS